MRVFLALFFASFAFCADKIATINLGYNATNISLKDEVLLISTDGGELQIYDTKTKKATIITFDEIMTHHNDKQGAKIYNADMIGGKILVLIQGDYGKKRLIILENGDQKSINLQDQSIKKAFFIDENKVILASIGNEISLLDLKSGEIIFSYQISSSTLSDMELSFDKKRAIIGCESGVVYIFDIAKRELTNSYGSHKDNIYDLSIASDDTIISASADRNLGIIAGGKIEAVASKFLVYAAGISKDGKFAAFMSSEDSDISVIEIASKRQIATIKTEQSTLNGLIFLDNETIISSAYEKTIYFWRF